ncbi:MAG: hypothetical protein ACYCW6_25420, partial [Candidatus Xenobia bacterium]
MTDDYQLLAAAMAFHSGRDAVGFADLAARIALSAQRHPAVHCEDMLSLSQDPFVVGLTDIWRREGLVEKALRHGDLCGAWSMAEATTRMDPDAGHALFDIIRRAHPGDPWTAAIMADAVAGMSSQAVLDALEQALELVRSGEARSHPALPDVECPRSMLEAFLDDHRGLVAAGRIRHRMGWSERPTVLSQEGHDVHFDLRRAAGARFVASHLSGRHRHRSAPPSSHPGDDIHQNDLASSSVPARC